MPTQVLGQQAFYPPPGGFLLFYPNMFMNSLSQQTNLPQQTNILISPPSIYEFFENLEKIYSECNFNEAKTKFLQEEIDVLDISSFQDCDWQRLGIKLGIKSKIIKEAGKYK